MSINPPLKREQILGLLQTFAILRNEPLGWHCPVWLAELCAHAGVETFAAGTFYVIDWNQHEPSV